MIRIYFSVPNNDLGFENIFGNQTFLAKQNVCLQMLLLNILVKFFYGKGGPTKLSLKLDKNGTYTRGEGSNQEIQYIDPSVRYLLEGVGSCCYSCSCERGKTKSASTVQI